MYIGNRCYRKNPVLSSPSGAGCDDDDDFSYAQSVDEYADESCSVGIDDKIEKTSTGYRLEVDLPNVFFKYIIGKKGETKKRLETETRTQIRIPRQHEEGSIVITGAERAGVISARTRIDVITTSARRNLPFTHFLSFPFVGGHVQTAFFKFKEDVLQKCEADRGIDSTIFQNPGKLHLTVGTLVLLNEAEIEKAAMLLNDYQQEVASTILRNEPMIADIRGLEYMNDDPGAVDVLYAKVSLSDGSNRLQVFSDKLVERFVCAGLMRREHDRVKLHITVMNSLMRRDPSDTILPQTNRHGAIKERESFDATNVLRLFGDFYFGEHHLDTLHISQRYSASPNDYYASAAKISLL